MTIKEKIQTLEDITKVLWKQLQDCEESLALARKKGIEEEVKLFEGFENEARARWAMANRVTKFLKNEIKAEEL